MLRSRRRPRCSAPRRRTRRASVFAIEATAERQLRAYVHVQPGSFNEQNEEGRRFALRPSVKNFEQTPPYDVSHLARISVLPRPLP